MMMGSSSAKMVTEQMLFRYCSFLRDMTQKPKITSLVNNCFDVLMRISTAKTYGKNEEMIIRSPEVLCGLASANSAGEPVNIARGPLTVLLLYEKSSQTLRLVSASDLSRKLYLEIVWKTIDVMKFRKIIATAANIYETI